MRLNRKAFLLAMGAALAAGGAGSASAATEIQFWHAFTGPLGEILAEQVEGFNGSQADYQVVAAYKGNYSETLNAGIAAFRAGQQPHILQVFEDGTATMMADTGAVNPVYEVMETGGEPLDPSVSLTRTEATLGGEVGVREGQLE